MIDYLHSAWLILLLVVGFGFVVFFHELGHFLAAKWVGIKVEQFALTVPEASWDEQELLLANTEELVRDLGLPYRVVVLPAGDMSSASAKTYDVEVWFPSQERYREAASISNTTDFQARRLGIRVRGERGLEPVHTLNGTAVVDRMALAILENLQGEVPDVLKQYGAPERVRP